MEHGNDGMTLETLAAMVKRGFNEVHGKIEGVKKSLLKKVGDLEEKVDTGFASVYRRMDELAELGNHEGRITKLEEEILP